MNTPHCGVKLVRLDEERVERDLHALAVVRIEDELAPLLDQGLGERLGEGPLRQGEVDRLAAALLARLVLGEKRELDPGAGPGMVGEVHDGAGRPRPRPAPGMASAICGAGTRLRLPLKPSPFSTSPSAAAMP